MSTLQTKTVRLGDSATLANNIELVVPSVPDGSFHVRRQDGTDIFRINSDGTSVFPIGSLGFLAPFSRIFGDFTNSNPAAKTAFQTTVANAATIVGAIPTGTGTRGGFMVYSTSDPNNASNVLLTCDSNEGRAILEANKSGAGPFLPLAFATGAAERMRIDTSGRLLFNTTTPRSNGVTIESDGSGLYVGPRNTGGEGGEITFGRGTDKAVAWSMDCLTGTTPELRIFNSGGIGVQIINGQQAWSAMSDVRLKFGITPLRPILPLIQKIECINYRFIGIDEPDSRVRVGVNAQSLVNSFDEVVDTFRKSGEDTEYLSVRHSDMVPYLIKAIQELKASLDTALLRIAELEARL